MVLKDYELKHSRMLTSGKTSKNWIPSKKQSREIYSPHAAVIWTTLFSWSKDIFLRWKDRIDQQESSWISYLSQLLVNTWGKKKSHHKEPVKVHLQ